MALKKGPNLQERGSAGEIGGKSSRQREEHVNASSGTVVCLLEDPCAWSPVT